MRFCRIVVPLAGTQPGVPVHALRQRFGRRQVLHVRVEAMPAPAVVHVGRYGGHVLDDTGLEPCLELEIVGFGVPLVAHLSGQKQFSLMECPHHGFFQINVLAVRQRHHGHGEVDMVGHGSHYGLEIVAALLEQFAEVAVALGSGKHVEHLLALAAVKVNIAQGRHFYHAGTHEVGHVLLAPVTFSFLASAVSREVIITGDGAAARRCVPPRANVAMPAPIVLRKSLRVVIV